MNKWRIFGLAVLVMSLGLMVGCGDKEAPTPDNTGDSGTTPDENIYVAKSDSLDELRKVGEMLEINVEDVGEIERHRGGGDDLVTIYWPQDDVTQEGLQTYRLDVGDEYEDDGKLEFRVGKKVLYSEQFAPDDTVTVAAIPQSVLDAIKKGKSVTWGIFFEGRRKKDSVKEKFKLVDGKKANKRLKKMEGSKHFARQKPLIQELLKTQVLEDNRLYSEALVQYLGILQAWPNSTQPFRGIVSCCRRMKLKETPLFTIASEFVKGKGGHARKGSSGVNPTATGGSSEIVLKAPKFQERDSNGFRPTQLGEHGGSTPGAAPTGTSPSTQPGSNTGGADAATRAKLGGQASQLQELADVRKREAEGLSQAVKDWERFEKEFDEAKRNLDQAKKDIENAQNTVNDLEARQGTANPPAAGELEKAREELENAREQAHQTGGTVAQMQQKQDEMKAQAGGGLDHLKDQAKRAEYEANMLQQDADKAREAFEMSTSTPQQQEQFREAARRAEIASEVAKFRQQVNDANQKARDAQSKVDSIQKQVEDARAAAELGTSGTAAEQALAGKLPDLLNELAEAMNDLGTAKDTAQQMEDRLNEMTGGK